MVSKIEVMPGSATPARVALAKVVERVKDGDTIFIIRISGDKIDVTTSGFKDSELSWAAITLTAYATHHALKDTSAIDD